MPIRVNLIEDADIRKQIKTMIDGQFRAMVREEVALQLKEAIGERIKTVCTDEKMIEFARNATRLEWYERSTLFTESVQKYIEEGYSAVVDAEMKKVDFEALALTVVREKMKK